MVLIVPHSKNWFTFCKVSSGHLTVKLLWFRFDEMKLKVSPSISIDWHWPVKIWSTHLFQNPMLAGLSSVPIWSYSTSPPHDQRLQVLADKHNSTNFILMMESKGVLVLRIAALVSLVSIRQTCLHLWRTSRKQTSRINAARPPPLRVNIANRPP